MYVCNVLICKLQGSIVPTFSFGFCSGHVGARVTVRRSHGRYGFAETNVKMRWWWEYGNGYHKYQKSKLGIYESSGGIMSPTDWCCWREHCAM